MRRSIKIAIAVVLLVTGSLSIRAQQSFANRFFRHNSSMATLQPSFVTPLVGLDPRLLQYARFSTSHQYAAAGTETVNFGNSRGIGLIAGDRFEFDVVPPPYIEHNSTAVDGSGDTSILMKYRVASGNAENGNYDVALILNHCFATGSYKNGAATDSFGPSVAAGYAFHHFDVISSLGGTLPTGRIDVQGRSIAWNAEFQAHLRPHVWVEVENNATFYVGGSHGGRVQNFVTPAAFYVVRGKKWKPTRPFFIVDAGMQMATSEFHTYNHNLISEVRMLF